MLVRLVRLSGQVKVRIGTVNCPYSSRSSGVRIVVTLARSVASGTPVTQVWLVTLLTLVTLLVVKLIFPGCQPYFSYGDLFSSGLVR